MSTTPGKETGSRRERWEGEPVVLFVEGYSDLRFYAEFLEHLGFTRSQYYIKELGGKGRSKLLNEARLLLKPDNLTKIQSVGVLLDADDDAGAAFRLAQKALQDATGVAVPTTGAWVSAASSAQRFGVFIAGGTSGMVEVESLAWAAWSADPKNDAFRGCVEEFVQCAEERGRRLKSLDKVRISALLAVLNEDDPRLGPGAQAKIFDFQAEVFDALRNFLSGLEPGPHSASLAKSPSSRP